MSFVKEPTAGFGGQVTSINIAQFVDDWEWTRFHQLVLLFAAMAFSADGIATQMLGISIPALVHAWGAPKEAFASVAAAGLVGVVIGAASGGIVGDWAGRRWGIIGSVMLFGAATAIGALTHNAPELTLLRFVAGLGIGGVVPNTAAFISEFTPLKWRSVTIAMSMVFIPVGAMLAGVIAALVMPAWGWQGYFIVCGVIPMALASLFLFLLPESPRFLARRPARRRELDLLMLRCGHVFAPTTIFIEPGILTGSGPIRVLFGEGRLRDTLALWSAFFFCFLASFTIFSWVPTMLAGQGYPMETTSLGMTAFNAGGIVGGVLCGWLIARFGSLRSLIGLCLLGITIALVLGLVPFHAPNGVSGIMVALMLQGISVAGLSNCIYTLTAFVYPSFARATGVGVAAAVGRCGAVISSFTGVMTLQLAGASGYFIVIAAAIAISLVSLMLVRRQIPPNQQMSDKRQPSLA